VTVAAGGGRRDELLAATRRVVGRVGFASTTVGEITREAGASLGLLHYHFVSKADVVAETFAQIAREDLAELEAAAGRDAAPAERLAATLELSGWADRESWRLWIDAWGEAVHSEPMRETLAGFQHGWRALVARVLADGARDGAWACADPEDAAGRLVAIIDGIGLHATLHPDAVPAEVAAAWVRRAAGLELGIELAAPAPRAPAAPDGGVQRRLTLRRGDRDGGGRLDALACAALLAEGRDAWVRERLDGAGATVARVAIDLRGGDPGGEAVTAHCALAHAGRTTVRTREALRDEAGATLARAESTLLLDRPLSAAEREALAR
jgi:AcrR family transcriptional regulator